ncbi:MAG: tetratricopeptide repeat protein [Candidatus Hydrogenedentes bacterium]|nr:tetratricopeptide repeat protein [Candidatus Hydrogenedentota bacterium]
MGSTISLAMIVKDEETQLADCLASVNDIVNEICIVDTGSRDFTIEVARSFSAKVGVYLWSDDFSAMRNESLRLCTMDWILVLDADERIAKDDLPSLKSLAKGATDCCYRFVTRNYTNNSAIADYQPCEPNDPQARGFSGWFPSTKVRLFPNRRGAAFQGKVHELVNQSLEQKGVRIHDSQVPIHHFPLLKDAERIREKQATYLQLGRDKAAANPNDPRAYAELGNQYAEVGDWSNAAASYSQALKLDSRNPGVLRDLGGALHMLQRPEEAKRALHLSLEIDSTQPAAWRNLGVVLADQKQWEAAADCFRSALKFDPAWPDGHRYLSVAIEGMGRLEEAVVESQTSLEKTPNDLECLKLYIHQMLRLERRPEARNVLLGLINGGARNPELHNALGELFFYDNLHDESKKHFLAAANAGLPAAYNNLGVVFFKLQQLDDAKRAFEKCLIADPNHRGAQSNLQKVLAKQALA